MEAQPLSMELQPNEDNTIGVTFVEQGGDHKSKEVRLHAEEGNFTLLGRASVGQSGGLYDKPLSCFGCGIGWFSFLLGFAFPPLWYYATLLYLGKYYLKEPRERPGLAASAIAALFCSVILVILLLAVFC